ncbi:MAG: CvpA family protein [Bacillota bacterium]
MPAFNFLDLGIILIIILSILNGYHKGMIRQIISIVALVAATYVAINYYQLTADYLNQNFSIAVSIAQVLSFGLIIITVSALINIIGFLLNRLTSLLLLSLIDSIGGAILGLIKGSLIVYILLILISKIPFPIMQTSLQSSLLAEKFLALTPFFDEHLTTFIN